MIYSKRIYENIAIYLEKNGWESHSTQYNNLLAFISKDHPNILLPYPTKFDSDETANKIDQIINILSKLVQTEKAIITNLLNRFDVDFHNYKVPGKDIFSVPLQLAEEIIATTRKLIFYSAQASYNDFKTYFDKDKKSKVDVSKSFVDQCNFGHTWKGSFGFTIEAPLNPKSIGIFGDNIPTFERKISMRIHDGMKIVKLGEEKNSADYIVEHSDQGFDGRMLNELMDIGDIIKYGELEYSTSWAPVLNVSNEYIEQNNFLLSTKTFDYIEKAASQLKEEEKEYEIVFLGFPEGFKSPKEQLIDRELEGNRFISVRGVSENIKESVLRMELSYIDYLKAVHAHENHKDLRIRCIVKKKTKGWEVLKILAMEVL